VFFCVERGLDRVRERDGERKCVWGIKFNPRARLNQLLEKLGYLELQRELRITLWDVLDYLELFYALNTQVLKYLELNRTL